MPSVCSSRGSSAEQVSQGRGAGLAAQRGVERAGLEGELCPPGLAQRVAGDSQVPGEVGLGRVPAQVLGQLPGFRADLKDQFLHRARDVDRPPLVPEVLLDLPADAGPREGRQAAAGGRVEVADRLQQPDVPHLDQVLGRLRAARVPPRARAHQVAVAADQQLTRRVTARAARRQRPCDRQQLLVPQPGQVLSRPAGSRRGLSGRRRLAGRRL